MVFFITEGFQMDTTQASQTRLQAVSLSARDSQGKRTSRRVQNRM